MKIVNKVLTFKTRGELDFIDMTDQIIGAISRAKVKIGHVLVFAKHTTAAVRIQEGESLLKEDLKKVLKRIARKNEKFGHNDFSIRTENMTPDESPNAHSHCQHLFLGSSEYIPISDGKLDLGIWQRIFLIELDKSRTRDVVVQVMGETR